MKLFFANVNFAASEEDLRELFETIGQVKRCSIIKTDGKSRGYGFVTYADPLDAARAVDDLNGQTFMGRKLLVQESKEKDNG